MTAAHWRSLALAGVLALPLGTWLLRSYAGSSQAAQYVPVTQAGKSGAGKAGQGEVSSESFGLTPAQAKRARKVIADSNCLVCHRIGDVGGTTGPDLNGYARRDIRADDLMVFLRNPRSWYPNTAMPAYPDMSEADLKLVANYVAGLVDAEMLRRMGSGADLSAGVCGPRFVPLDEK